MSNNIQYRLHQFETAPPAGSWNRISDRLDEEYDAEDISLSQKVSAFEQAPPATSFLKIMAGLDAISVDSDPAINIPSVAEIPAVYTPAATPVIDINRTTDRQSSAEIPIPQTSDNPRGGLVIPMRLRRVAAAAVICVAIAALYLYFNTGSRQADVSALISTSTKAVSLSPSAPSSANTLPAPSVAGTMPATIASIGALPLRTSPRKRTGIYENNRSASIQASYEPDSDNANLSYAAISTRERNNAEQDIVIPTEPIRDQDGNIIMDEKLVSTPDVNYVTVTGPNGEQTKISKKFLHALGYMNARSSADDFAGITLHEGSLWKWLFQEWRQKLLTQPSFIPSATNFLDIMELKEILHENF